MRKTKWENSISTQRVHLLSLKHKV